MNLRRRLPQSLVGLRWGLLAAAISLGSPALALADSADDIANMIQRAGGLPDEAARTRALRAAAERASTLAERADRGFPLWTRLQSDRLFALSLAGDHADAVRVYDELAPSGIVKPYLASAAARSLMAAGRTDEGEAVLRRALSDHPGDVSARLELAEWMAHHDRLADARVLLDEWLIAADGTPADGVLRRDVTLRAARYARWSEDFVASERYLDALAHSHPDDATVREARGALERQRGRPRAALAQIDEASRVPAERVIAALSWLDLGRTDHAAWRVDRGEAAEIDKRLDAQRAARGNVGIGFASTDSPAPASPNGAEARRSWLQAETGRLAERWRLGARLAQHRAEFRGLEPEVQLAGLRAVRHGTGGETSFELGRTFDDFLEQTYGVIDAGYWTSDAWRFGVRAALSDPQGPLQARASGIGMDSLALSATWRPEPSWRIDVDGGASRFDDDNERSFGALSGERRLHAAGSTRTTGVLRGYTMRNSLATAPYFNPGEASSVELGVVHRVEAPRGLQHTLRPSVAGYWQREFDARAVPVLGYEMALPTAAGIWSVDVTASQPVYDGQRETRIATTLGFTWGAW